MARQVLVLLLELLLLRCSVLQTSSDYISGVVRRFLQQQQIEECPICCDFPPEPVLLTTCCHTLCYACALLLLNCKRNLCPLCRISFTFKDIKALPLPPPSAASTADASFESVSAASMLPPAAAASHTAEAANPALAAGGDAAAEQLAAEGAQQPSAAAAWCGGSSAATATFAVSSTATAAARGTVARDEESAADVMTGQLTAAADMMEGAAAATEATSGAYASPAVGEVHLEGAEAATTVKIKENLFTGVRKGEGGERAEGGSGEQQLTEGREATERERMCPSQALAAAAGSNRAVNVTSSEASIVLQCGSSTEGKSSPLNNREEQKLLHPAGVDGLTRSFSRDGKEVSAHHPQKEKETNLYSVERKKEEERLFFFSSKMKTAIALLVEDVRCGRSCVVFSQWTSMLDRMEEAFTVYERRAKAEEKEAAGAVVRDACTAVAGSTVGEVSGDRIAEKTEKCARETLALAPGRRNEREKERSESMTHGRLLPYRRLDGSMSSRQRQEVLHWFWNAGRKETAEEVSRLVEEDKCGLSAGLSVPPGHLKDNVVVEILKARYARRVSPFAGRFTEQRDRNRSSKINSTGEGSSEEGEACEKGSILLCSLKAGNVGLNLTKATRCYLMDGWWNPQVEQQAMKRIWRFGQNKPVHVIRFVCLRTVEERLEELKEFKGWMAHGACEGDHALHQWYPTSPPSEERSLAKFHEAKEATNNDNFPDCGQGGSSRFSSGKCVSYVTADVEHARAGTASDTYNSCYGTAFGNPGHGLTFPAWRLPLSNEENRQRGKLTLEDLKRIFAGFESEELGKAEFYDRTKYPGPGLEFEAAEGSHL